MSIRLIMLDPPLKTQMLNQSFLKFLSSITNVNDRAAL